MTRLRTLVGIAVVLSCLAPACPAYGDDYLFTTGHRALAIPFDLIDDHIYLRVSVEGSPPLSFVLDSGANSDVLGLRTARSLGLGLQKLDKVPTGIGDQPPDAYLITDHVSFSLPGVVLSGQSLVAIPLEETQACLNRTGGASAVDGILGKGFFSHFVVEIDYPARVINLFDPATYTHRGRGKTLPLDMDAQFIFVRARVKAPRRPPVTARLVVDTGAGALSLTQAFAREHDLLPPAGTMTLASECGIAGVAGETTLVGTLESLQLGGFTLSNPLTVFYPGTGARWYDGLLGGTALRNFKVIFDYSHRRMILDRPR